METSYERPEKTLVVRISEEIDQYTVDKIKRKIDDEIEKYIPKKVIFDFEDITFMDSSGIGMILGRYKLIKLIGGEMEIINVNKIVNRIFKMSGIGRIIKITLKEESDKTIESSSKFNEEKDNYQNAKSKYDDEYGSYQVNKFDIQEEEKKNEGAM